MRGNERACAKCGVIKGKKRKRGKEKGRTLSKRRKKLMSKSGRKGEI